MEYNTILKEIEKIKEQLEFIHKVKIDVEPVKMSAIEFNAIVNSIKKYDILEKTDSAYFANVFDNNDYYANISIYLDQIIRRISIKKDQKGVSLKVSKNLRKAEKHICVIIDVLSVEYGNLLKADSKKWVRKYIKERAQIKAILVDLSAIKGKIKNILSVQSQIIANVILGEFKVLYKFFLYSIKTAKIRQDELLLVEIAGMTDRIISMIEPVFSDKSLKADEMIYHYLTYELKELKVDAIGENLS